MHEKRIGILAEDDFEDLELYYPYFRLIEAGCKAEIIGSRGKDYYKGKKGLSIKKDVDIESIAPQDYDGVIIPGGWAPDRLRRSDKICSFVRGIYEQGKLVASICHGPWVLVSSNIVKGHTMTSTQAIKDDLVNAGAHWVDRAAVRDGNIITSRNPHDLPAFMKEILSFID